MTPEPIAEEILLADTRWLHALLERLVGDRHVAEDLHQEALLAAWAHGASGPVTRSWLSRVARNLAVSFRRSATRRARAEENVGHDPASSSPPELIMEAELQGRAVEAVLSLDEPYRKTVLLRYMKGHSLAEVAGEMSVPTETVRTRQRRALELLREKLGVRERRRAWLPIAWPGWAMGTAVMTMSKKSAIAAFSVLAFLALGWLVVPLTVETPKTAPNTTLSLDTVTLNSEEASPETLSVAATDQRTAVPVSTTGSIEVIMTWKETGEPAEGIPTRLTPRSDDPGVVQVTNSHGLVRFEALEPGRYTLQSIHSNIHQGLAVEKGEILRREFSLAQGLRGNVTVVDPQGTPVAGSVVVAVRGGYHPAWRFPLGTTDEQGQLQFKGMHRYHMLGATSDSLGTSAFLLLHGEILESDSTRPITLTLPGAEGSVIGRVFEPSGAPVVDAVVLVQFGKAGKAPDDKRLWLNPSSPTTHSDSSGSFSLPGLPQVKADLVVLKDGFAPYSQSIDLDHGPLTGHTVLLEEGGIVEGKVTDERGQPISSVICRTITTSTFKNLDPSVAGDGTFRMDHVPSGAFRIEFTSSNHSSWHKELTISDGASYQITAVLESLESQRCRLIDAEGNPLAGWWFHAGPNSNGKTDEQGFFDLAIQDGRRESLSFWNDWQMGPIIHTFGPIDLQPELVTLELPTQSMPSIWLTGRVLGTGDEPLASISMRITQPDVYSWEGTGRSVWPDHFETDANGRFRIGPLPPGRYILSALHASLAFPQPEVTVEAKETRDVGVLNGLRAAYLYLTIPPPTDSSSDRLAYLLLDEQGNSTHLRSGDSTPLAFACLYPGTYRIAVVEDGRNRVLEEVTLLPGDRREVQLSK